MVRAVQRCGDRSEGAPRGQGLAWGHRRESPATGRRLCARRNRRGGPSAHPGPQPAARSSPPRLHVRAERVPARQDDAAPHGRRTEPGRGEDPRRPSGSAGPRRDRPPGPRHRSRRHAPRRPDRVALQREGLVLPRLPRPPDRGHLVREDRNAAVQRGRTGARRGRQGRPAARGREAGPGRTAEPTDRSPGHPVCPGDRGRVLSGGRRATRSAWGPAGSRTASTPAHPRGLVPRGSRSRCTWPCRSSRR